MLLAFSQNPPSILYTTQERAVTRYALSLIKLSQRAKSTSSKNSGPESSSLSSEDIAQSLEDAKKDSNSSSYHKAISDNSDQLIPPNHTIYAQDVATFTTATECSGFSNSPVRPYHDLSSIILDVAMKSSGPSHINAATEPSGFSNNPVWPSVGNREDDEFLEVQGNSVQDNIQRCTARKRRTSEIQSKRRGKRVANEESNNANRPSSASPTSHVDEQGAIASDKAQTGMFSYNLRTNMTEIRHLDSNNVNEISSCQVGTPSATRSPTQLSGNPQGIIDPAATLPNSQLDRQVAEYRAGGRLLLKVLEL